MSEMAAPARSFRIAFGATGRPAVSIEEGMPLSVALTISNSPILFGCRDAICGTCLSKVQAESGALPPQSPEEKELLNILCPNEPKARLACQLKSCADITIEPLKPL
jgi:ferredoxin